MTKLKVGMISLGCNKNRVDSETALGLLREHGYELTNDPAQADVLMVNTCGFIASAKEESIDAILDMARYKQIGKCRALVVTGCLAQRYGDALLSDMPEIDALLGVNQYAQIVQAVEEAMQGERVDLRARSNQMLECGRVLTTPAYSAYVRIGEGCNNRCAYCAIPLIRGGYRSRDEQAILDEMRMLSQNGAKEQILISQDTSRYGSDCGGSLRGLIARAALVPGVEWLRVLYMYPDEIDEALLEEMARHDNVCKYLDLPLQHASPTVLRRMNRRGDINDARRLLLRAREMGFTLRTTFIVGFPGETQEDFQQLMDFTREVRFDRMGAFKYSQEADTPAAAMPDQVPEEIKTKRSAQLLALAESMSREFRAYYVGKEEEVLFEEPMEVDGETWYTGYTKEYVKIAAKTEEPLDNVMKRGRVEAALTDEIYRMKL